MRPIRRTDTTDRRSLRRPRAGLVLLAVLTSLLTPWASAQAADPARDRATFGIGPAGLGAKDPRGYFSYQMGLGGSYADKVAVLNYGGKPLTLGVFAADLGNNQDGSLGVGLQKDTPREAGSWVHLPRRTTSVLVPPASPRGPGRVLVPFTIAVPQSASPGDHGAALVAVLSSIGKNPKGENVRLDQRIASRIYIRVAGALQPQLRIERLRASYSGTANPVGRGRATVTYIVHNVGNVRVAAGQRVSVRGLFGSTASVATPAKIELLFPGASTTVRVSVPGVLPTVRLHARVTVTPLLFSDQAPVAVTAATAQVGFWAVPWTLLLLLLALLGLVWFVRRRRRNRKANPGGRARHAASRGPRPGVGPPAGVPAGGADLVTSPASSLSGNVPHTRQEHLS